MNIPLPILAALEDVLKVLVPLLAALIWLVAQVFAERQKGERKNAKLPEPDAAEGNAPIELDREIEAFLKETKDVQREPDNRPRRQRQKRAGQGLEVPVEVLVPRAEPSRGTVEVVVARPVGEEAPVEAIVVERVRPGQNVAEHVQKHIDRDAEQLAVRAQSLGRDVAREGERFSSQLDRSFDRNVSHLSADLEKVAGEALDDPIWQERATGESLGQEIAETIHDPAQVRRAFLLQEIFNRPTDRW